MRNDTRSSSKNSVESIQQKIDQLEPMMVTLFKDYLPVEAKELIAYFDGEAPSGDITTVDDVISNEFLLVHELVEISELKRLGFKISAQLLWTNPAEVDRAHIIATTIELAYAHQQNADMWIVDRLQDVKVWLEDDKMASDLRSRCQSLLQQYSS